LATDRRELIADATLSRAGDWLAGALTSAFGVRPEPRSAQRSVWLDSVDWRLLRAGLVLRQTGRSPRRELMLESVTGEPIMVEPVSDTWPSIIDASPSSALRTRLAATLGVRALLAMAEVDVHRTHARLVDGEDKTVVYATIEDARQVQPHSALLPVRITLTAVRGYERELKRAADLLCSVSGIEPAVGSTRESALAAAGRPAGEYSTKVDVQLDASAPAARSVATVLLRWLDIIEANVAGCTADIDTEYLHDVRIAVRQTRTLLKSLGDVLPPGVPERFADEWRWLSTLTTPTRDLDVVLLGLAGRTDAFDIRGLSGLEPLRKDLARQRRSEFRRMRTGLASPRLTALLREWRTALIEIDPAAAPGVRTDDVAVHRLGRAHRRVVKNAAMITSESSAEAVHDLRKRCKELRYLLEAFASLYDEKARRRVVKDLKIPAGPARRRAGRPRAPQHVDGVRPFHRGRTGSCGHGACGRRSDRSARHPTASRARRARHCIAAGHGCEDRCPPESADGGRGVRILATYNIKGGVGKTSTAVNLAYLAARGGARTLLWDLDPQAAATYVFRIRPRVKGGGKRVIRGSRPLEGAIKGTDFANLDLLPADFSYRHMDLMLDAARKPTRQLGRVLEPLADDYDVVILDCPPSMSLVSENVLRACDTVLVPLIPTTLSVRTLDQLTDFVADSNGHRPTMLGFFSMVDRRKRLHREIMQSLSAQRDDLAATDIPALSVIEQMAFHRAPVPVFAPHSVATRRYEALAAETLPADR